MPTIVPEFDVKSLIGKPSAADEARVSLEYHALMGVKGGDQPSHVRSFDRNAQSSHERPARDRDAFM